MLLLQVVGLWRSRALVSDRSVYYAATQTIPRARIRAQPAHAASMPWPRPRSPAHSFAWFRNGVAARARFDRLPAGELEGVIEYLARCVGAAIGRHPLAAGRMAAKRRERGMHGRGNAEKERSGIRDVRVAQLTELRRRRPRHAGGLEDCGREAGAVQFASYTLVVGDRLEPGDEHRIDAELEERFSAAQRFVEAEHAERIGAADDERIGTSTFGQRDAKLALDHAAIDHSKRAVGALLLVLALLVFDKDCAHADLFVKLDHPCDAFDIAITVVAVGKERKLGGRCDIADAGRHVGHADEPDVGKPESRREHRRSTDRERLESRPRDQAR